MTTLQAHELVHLFRRHRLALNPTLEQMLNEHYSHQTERRGCGYTQASRHLAEYINQPRSTDNSNDLRLLQDWQLRSLPDSDNATVWQQQLRQLPALMKREESRVLAQMIVDILLPVELSEHETAVIPAHPEKLAIGSCPLAEKYFLELAHRHVKRHGLMNIIINDNQQPVIVEKMHLGDDHSCLSLVPLLMNGVRLPAGSLLGVDYNSRVLQKTRRKSIPGCLIRLADCRGFRFLRLTTLVISPANRARAFTTHFAAQQANGLFAPDSTRLSQLLQIAHSELRHADISSRRKNVFFTKTSVSI